MIQASNLDFKKTSMIMNVILHLVDETTLESIVTNDGQIAYSTSDGYIHLMSDGVLKQIAFTSDIEENVRVYYQTLDPRDDGSGNLTPLPVPAIWFNPDDETLKIYIIDSDTWRTISDGSGSTASIPTYVGGNTYGVGENVIYNNRLWQNQTGGDITDAVWTEVNWTNIGNTVDVADLRTSTFSIPTSLGDGNTSGGVTRNGDVYTVNHQFNKQYVGLIMVDTSFEQVFADFTYTDSDNVNVSFYEPIEEDFFVIIKD